MHLKSNISPIYSSEQDEFLYILTIGLLLQIADSLGFRLSGTNVFCSMFIIARWAARNNADTAAVSAALSEKY